MKLFKSIKKLLLITVTLIGTSQHAYGADKKVLMVVSSHGEKQGEVAPGYEFDELSKAYLVFKNNDIAVDIASPKGGKVEADKYNPEKSYNKQLLDDSVAFAKINNTLKLNDVNAKDYDGVFVVGGKGAMFDLPKDKTLQNLIADVYQQHGAVAAVCHGPAALVDVKLADGSYLVANKKVNGFTNKEEQLFGKKWLPKFEFLLQDKLIERGGKFQSSDIMLNHVAVDTRLVTGQNPASTVGVANEMIRQMGISPKTTELDQEDRTLELIAKFLTGDKNALVTLTSDEQKYHVPLAGIYGFYYLKAATTDLELNNALNLMIAGKKAINNPKLDMQIAKTQHKLGRNQQAKNTLNQLVKSNPDFQPAIDMLKTLSL